MKIEINIKKTWLAPSPSEGGRLSSTDALAMTRTGRSRLEHRHGWLDVVMTECHCSQGLEQDVRG